MVNDTICLKCGTPLAMGAREAFCPKCLFAEALAGGSGEPPGQLDEPLPRADGHSGSIAPASVPATVVPQFPQTFGDYELLEEIARGGMGIVYRARQVSLDRIVAVKMLLFGPLSSPEFIKRFRAEASAAASLQHPNIVAIHEVGVHQGQQFFAMDYVEGQSLASLLANGPLPARRATKYLKTIAEAIHYAHERGLLHRDLKPSNVLIDVSDEPRVTDFGLARRLEGDSELTVTGQVLGSPNYMPPEQAVAKGGKVSRRSDVHSLGATLYHALAGRPPFVGETLPDTLNQVLNADPVSPRLLNRSVPRDLETVCLKCMEKEPEKRYATAQALADELGRFLNNEPVNARPLTRGERIWRWCRRKPALATTIVLVLLLLLVVGVGSPIAAFRINKARKASDAESLKARQFAYAADMNYAHAALTEGNTFRALELLERHRPRDGVPASAGPARAASAAAPDRLKTGPQTDLRGWEWRYLWREAQGDPHRVLARLTEPTFSIGVLPDGKTVFASCFDKRVHLWDLESGRETGALSHPEKVLSAAASPDGKWMVTSMFSVHQNELPVRLWDLTTMREVAVLTTNFWLRAGMAFSPDSRLVAFPDNYKGIHLWDVAGRREITNLPSYYPYFGPLGVALSPDSRVVAYGEHDTGDIVLWDIERHATVGRLSGHKHAVIALAFSPDGRLLASGSRDRTAKLWDLSSQREQFSFTQHKSHVGALAFSPDARVLATASSDQQIRLFDPQTGELLAELSGHTHYVAQLAFTADGGRLLSTGGDGTVRVWEMPPHPRERGARELAHGISQTWNSYGRAICLSPDGVGLVNVFTNNTFTLWHTPTLTESRHYDLPFTNASFVAVAPGGRLCAFASWDGQIVLWDANTSQARPFARPETNRFNRLAFSRDGEELAMASDSEDGRIRVRVWDVPHQRELHLFSPNEDTIVMSLAFSESGHHLAAGFYNGNVRVWDLLESGREIVLRGHGFQVRGLMLLPDNRTLISTSTEILIWDIATGKAVLRLNPRPTGYAKTYRGISLSTDQRRVAIGAYDGHVTIWDVASWQEVATLSGHRENVYELAFLPEGNTLVSASYDQLRLWRATPFAETDSPRPPFSRASKAKTP